MTKAQTATPTPKTLRTVEHALQFMEVVAQSSQSLKVKDVATELGINLSTSYHLLKTLLGTGYIDRDSTGSLSIGRRVTLLHQGMMRQRLLGRELYPIVVDLSTATRETSYLAVLGSDGLVIEALVEGSHPVRVAGLHVGFSGEEHRRASGKVVLAFLDESARAPLLEKSLSKVASRSRRAILTELDTEFEEIRSQGWALDYEKFQVGVCCVASPFFQADGMVAGSISLSAPTSRFIESAAMYTTAVHRAAVQASNVIGQLMEHA